MPARPKTTDAQIVEAALRLVERQGPDGFSMNDVAAAVGIRAPSLYGRFRDRASLIVAVELQVWADIVRFLEAAVIADDPEATLMAQAQAMRRFAKRNPNTYSLFFDIRTQATQERVNARAAGVATLMPALRALVGERHATAASRVLVPFVHGFISMEIAHGFGPEADLDDVLETGLLTLLWGFGRFAEA